MRKEGIAALCFCWPQKRPATLKVVSRRTGRSFGSECVRRGAVCLVLEIFLAVD